MAEVYGNFEFAQKAYTRGSDVGKGAIGLPNLDPPLFLEFKLVKLHTHSGVDSQPLKASATPEMVRGFKTYERTERGVAQWTGGSSSSGSVVLTFGTAFQEAPSVFVTPADGNSDIIVGVSTPSITAVTIYWRDEAGGGHTALNLQYIIIGR